LKAGEYWEDHDLVFATKWGRPMHPENVNRAFGALCERAEVRRLRVHGMRHTCATLLLAQGVDARVVMEILGHSQIAVTMNTYTHVVSQLQAEAMAKMDGVLELGEAADDTPDQPVVVKVVVNGSLEGSLTKRRREPQAPDQGV
jgi:integrase